MELPSRVTICEVGLRDGLQNESKILDVDQKYQWVQKFIESGLRVIELGSFMSPKAVPQMADTDDLYRMIPQKDGIELRALVVNRKGVDRAIECGCKKIKLNVSASLKHNLVNINKTPEESVAGFSENVQLAKRYGLEVSGSISMPFGSPWEGRIPIEQVEKIIEAYLQVGVLEISLSDASGMAVPNQVHDLCTMVQEKYPKVVWWLHFHNTRGMGMANILAAMEAGITRFDASIGGLGGCPFVPGAAGNVTTEDVVHMMDEMGVYTGIDLLKLMDIAKEIQYHIGHTTDSYVLKAGRSKDLIR
ncbi:MAG: hydroxymethylglutaryl-CoA lyase [Peptostreptococcaceae bacterium]|nr:hydroxymethylglutaryl-CoA lyase [Peptostreptococcaceae bacterium]